MELEDSRLRNVLDDLTEDEMIVMAKIERTPKVGNSGAFSADMLKRKKACREMEDFEGTLKNLQNKALIYQFDSGRNLWKATPDGRIIEHYLSLKMLSEMSGISTIQRR